MFRSGGPDVDAYRRSHDGVPLAFLRLRQILHLDDQHIPLPVIRLYYNELERPEHERDKEAMMVGMLLLREWHVTRANLNFVRDVAKVAVGFSKRFTDRLSLLDMALTTVQVTPQDVYEAIVRRLRENCTAQGVSLSEYLERLYDGTYRTEQDRAKRSLAQTFPELYATGSESAWNSFTAKYAIRVLKHMLRTVGSLDSSTAGFFEDSAPSWSLNEDAERRAEGAKLRRELIDKLLRMEREGGEVRTPLNEKVGPAAAAAAAAVEVVVAQDDDAVTVDTDAFRCAAAKFEVVVDDDKEKEKEKDTGVAKPEMDEEEELRQIVENETRISDMLDTMRKKQESEETGLDDDGSVTMDDDDDAMSYEQENDDYDNEL